MAFRRISGEQIRAARALARLDQSQLASLTALSLDTIKRLERIRGPVDSNARTLEAIVGAFRGVGIEFDACEGGSVGVCLKSGKDREARDAPAPEGAIRDSVGAPRQLQPLYRLIYHSRAAPAVAARMAETVEAIARQAIRVNGGLGITGALLAADGWFLQALEGPRQAVQQLYGAITMDERHTDLQLLSVRAVAVRQFGDWALCYGHATDRAAFGDEPAMADGFQPQLLTPASALGLLATLRDLQLTFQRCVRGRQDACVLAGRCLEAACPHHSTVDASRTPRA